MYDIVSYFLVNIVSVVLIIVVVIWVGKHG